MWTVRRDDSVLLMENVADAWWVHFFVICKCDYIDSLDGVQNFAIHAWVIECILHVLVVTILKLIWLTSAGLIQNFCGETCSVQQT